MVTLYRIILWKENKQAQASQASCNNYVSHMPSGTRYVGHPLKLTRFACVQAAREIRAGGEEAEG
jgi:hypothetical protein